MSTLHDLRQGVIEAVAQVPATTFDHVPARFSPPALLVLPGSPYVEPGNVFGHFLVRHSVSVVVPNGDNEKVTEDVDNLIESTLLALVNANLSVESVSTFYVFESNQAQYLAADIFVTDTVSL